MNAHGEQTITQAEGFRRRKYGNMVNALIVPVTLSRAMKGP